MKHQKTASSVVPAVTPKKKETARAKSKKSDTVDASPVASADGHEYMIRQAAYFLYEARGREDGHELDDWLHAQAQAARMGPGNA